jgi:hypothetical protein
MDANRHSPIDFESRVFLLAWCLLGGLALAPLPALHAMPAESLYFVFGWPAPDSSVLTKTEILYYTLAGTPLVPIFLAWALPGVGRPSLPKRSIVVLCLLVAYNPIRYYFETHFYGDVVARMVVVFDEASVANWVVRHLDTPLLIGLAVTARLRRHALRPLWKSLFHWILFVCALWAAGPPLFDLRFYGGFRVSDI